MRCRACIASRIPMRAEPHPVLEEEEKETILRR
eukprot:COSAG01_NODE_55456_length_325_cov_0.486726_2_plen_32_part_01